MPSRSAATNYNSGKSYLFIQGKKGHAMWNRSRRVTLATKITVDHICASAAIPLVFRPVKLETALGAAFFGDGCIRLQQPLSPVVRLGAQRIVALAEKPSVARDIARAGRQHQRRRLLHGNGYVVTWAIGHLAALAQPHEIRPEWKAWRRDLLPMLPEAWPLVVYEKTKDQFEVVRKILNSPRVAASSAQRTPAAKAN
jgi:predicted acylesterase/phospholipase RssA